jgi:hypothetical protein
MLHIVSEERPDPRRARRSHRRNDDLLAREFFNQCTNERHGRLHLANRNGMYPDAFIDLWKTETEALPELLEVAAIANAFKKPVEGVWNQKEISQ